MQDLPTRQDELLSCRLLRGWKMSGGTRKGGGPVRGVRGALPWLLPAELLTGTLRLP